MSPAEEDDIVRILSGRAVTSICTAGTLRDKQIKKNRGGEEERNLTVKKKISGMKVKCLILLN